MQAVISVKSIFLTLYQLIIQNGDSLQTFGPNAILCATFLRDKSTGKATTLSRELSGNQTNITVSVLRIFKVKIFEKDIIFASRRYQKA